MAITEFLALRAAAGLPRRAAADYLKVRPSLATRWEKGNEQAPQEVLGALREKGAARALPRSNPGHLFTFVDLFAGIGGMRQSFEAAGGSCLFTAEWNEYAVQTYAANFGAAHPIVGDLRAVPASDIPDHDVLVGGFPCQAFSIAGVSKKKSMGRPHGFEDKTQGTLFFEVARILKEKRPRAFFLENVKNLVAHDGGNTFRIILDTLREELGYKVSYRILDAKHWVPQRRKRIFIVGFRDGAEFDFGTVAVPDTFPKLNSILHAPGEEGSENCPYAPGGVPDAQFTVGDKVWAYLKFHAAKHQAAGNGFGFSLVGPEDIAGTLPARYYKDGADILIGQPDRNPRRLTPRECARLMGFDRPGVARFEIPVSPTQAYKQFGNSVVVPKVQAVAEALAARLLSEDTEVSKAA